MRIQVALLLVLFPTATMAWDEVYGHAPSGDTCPGCPRSWTMRGERGSWACKRIDNKPVCGPYRPDRTGHRDLDVERVMREGREHDRESKLRELEERVGDLEDAADQRLPSKP